MIPLVWNKSVHTNYGARYIENVYSSDARRYWQKFGDENTGSLSMREMSISGTVSLLAPKVAYAQ